MIATRVAMASLCYGARDPWTQTTLLSSSGSPVVDPYAAGQPTPAGGIGQSVGMGVEAAVRRDADL